MKNVCDGGCDRWMFESQQLSAFKVHGGQKKVRSYYSLFHLRYFTLKGLAKNILISRNNSLDLFFFIIPRKFISLIKKVHLNPLEVICIEYSPTHSMNTLDNLSRCYIIFNNFKSHYLNNSRSHYKCRLKYV